MILRQHGLQVWEPEEPISPEEFCYQALDDVPMDVLVELHEFATGDDAAPVASAVASTGDIWAEGLPARVFLSHLHDRRQFVAQAKNCLANLGIAAFVAHDDINPSNHWRGVIKAGLASCDALVAFMDDGFHASQWCDQEVGWALGRNIPVLPVRPIGFDRSTASDGFIEEHQDLLLDKAEGYPAPWLSWEILKVLLGTNTTNAVGVRALGEALVRSSSYDRTRDLWRLIEEQSTIESDTLRRIEFAGNSNRQVYEAGYGYPSRKIPELIEELVLRHEPPPPRFAPDYGEEPF